MVTRSPVATDRRKLLRIYLNDHLAGATAGVRLARRSLRSNRGTPLGAFLGQLVDEVEEDRAALERLIAAFAFPRGRVKVAAAVAAEWIGRGKLNGRLIGYSDLSRVLELEGLYLGAEGKRRLWLNLQRIAESHDAIAALDLDRLIARASSQLERLEHHRSEAAARAFA
ncbi:MAG TPA: hypothetical protein VM324_02990 [Egibacteraceae bacterium]|jgi:hypothetical protein|nr:hypothetical protein [Egibacteraceae bacterium]